MIIGSKCEWLYEHTIEHYQEHVLILQYFTVDYKSLTLGQDKPHTSKKTSTNITIYVVCKTEIA